MIEFGKFSYFWLDTWVMAKKGVNSGKEFWSCSGYPECNGTRRIS